MVLPSASFAAFTVQQRYGLLIAAVDGIVKFQALQTEIVFALHVDGYFLDGANLRILAGMRDGDRWRIVTCGIR